MELGLDENWCRNPDGRDRPWCYYQSPESSEILSDFCQIDECKYMSFVIQSMRNLDLHDENVDLYA